MSQEEHDDFHKWTHQNTLLLLELYKKYRDHVGSSRLKNFKRMFEEIAKDIQTMTKKHITPANCENRWKVLERNYKKYVDNINKTGRGRKVFEYYDIMHTILGKKKNISPVLLLSSDTIIQSINSREIDIAQDSEVEGMEIGPSTSSSIKIEEDNLLETGFFKKVKEETLLDTTNFSTKDDEETLSQTPECTITGKVSSVSKTPKRTYDEKRLTFNILKEIRNDRKEYYSRRLNIEEEKLNIEERKLQQKVKTNELFERRNKLLEKLLAERDSSITADILPLQM